MLPRAGTGSEEAAEPIAEATIIPTAEATMIPTPEPTADATIIPTPEPTAEPTPEPTANPAEAFSEADYVTTLFDASYVHRIDVRVPERDWDDLLKNPTEKTKYRADITIDGETLEGVSFATKGNSSLFFVAADPESDRYSFKINFGSFEKGQTYHGLRKLNLNNGFCDATGIKDYLSYELFRENGVPAPLTSFVRLTVNGEDRGLYLAVEDVGKDFLKRTYGGEGVIYKPESTELELSLDQIGDILEHGLPAAAKVRGADLVYRDDDPKSYPDIFENAETKITAWSERDVIAALRSMAEGTDLDAHLDTDEIIRFFAVHNFLLNYDSYTGFMLHNLVLAEQNGRLSLVPWDYNLAFGTFIPGVGKRVLTDATDLINLGIDDPLLGTTEDARPMWRWIVRDETYRKAYHDALGKLLSDCIESGRLEQKIDALYAMLLPYVEQDPTAFYSAKDFQTGCEALKQFCRLRAESIRRQLNGQLASRGAEQDGSGKVWAHDLRIRDLGVFDAGDE